ncbi:hypothetical protein FMUND_6065 [Fusarium mundagurra]|uniref:Uncharacterized protein n=1 Tax=Fusarium mundagurra TaxID=1567541 RepID=A0A8H5YRJ2_9HYPO|nr:hypothetical protein FMUND_6065 [Fusarium mundagurra]
MEELADDREDIALETKDTQPDSALRVKATSERLFLYNRFMRDMDHWFLREQRENACLMKDYISKFRTIDANQPSQRPAKKLKYTKSELKKWFILDAVRSEFSYDPIHNHFADVLGVAGDDLTTAAKDYNKTE